MKNYQNILTISLTLSLSLLQLIYTSPAQASSDCYGQTTDGKAVTIHIETKGALSIPSRGEILFEDGQNHFGYQMSHEDISQYFEYDETSDGSAVVGLMAFSHGEAPVSIKYQGPNYKDMDLKVILAEGGANNLKSNFIRVWKGPGYDSASQYQITKIVCATWPDL